MSYSRLFTLVLIACVGTLAFQPHAARADQKAIADARKALADANAAVKKAQDAYTAARDVVKQKIEGTPEAKAQLAAVTKGKADVDAASKPAIEKSHQSVDYKKAQAIYDEADAKIKASQTAQASGATGAASDASANIVTYTTTRRTAKETMDKLDADAVASDPDVQKAKQALDAAQAKVADLEKQVDDAAAADTNCQTAQKTLDDAKKAVDDAKAKLADAIKANQGEHPHGGNSGSRTGGGHGAGGHNGGGH